MAERWLVSVIECDLVTWSTARLPSMWRTMSAWLLQWTSCLLIERSWERRCLNRNERVGIRRIWWGWKGYSKSIPGSSCSKLLLLLALPLLLALLLSLRCRAQPHSPLGRNAVHASLARPALGCSAPLHISCSGGAPCKPSLTELLLSIELCIMHREMCA